MQVLDWKPEFPEIERIVADAWRWHTTHSLAFAGLPEPVSPHAAMFAAD
jgi:hypothetical protein